MITLKILFFAKVLNLLMTNVSLLAQIKSDYQAHGRDWTKPGFRSMAVYRFGVWRMAVKPKILRAPLSIIYRSLFRHCRNKYGIEVPYSAKIGQRVVIEHQSGIIIHGNAQIGDDSYVRQNVTIGIKNLDQLDAAPTIGKGVNIGAGAVILGNIHIGDGASIGANSVVIKDVPAGYLAVGVPAVLKPGKSA